MERLESKSRSRDYIEKASADIAGIKEIPKEEAEELVYHYIREIIDAFQNMDDILEYLGEQRQVLKENGLL